MSISFNNYYRDERPATLPEVEDLLDRYMEQYRHENMDLQGEVTYLIKTVVQLQGEVFQLKQELEKEKKEKEERRKKIGFEIEDYDDIQT